MKALAIAAGIATGIASVAVPTLAQAQQTTTGSGITWPHQRGFWGHVGASYGRSDLSASCPSGFSCDDKDQAFRVFAGGRFNNTIGAEIGWINMGEWSRGGGDTDAQALDIALTAGFPLGRNSSIFGKIGTAYTRAEVSGGTGGIQTGREDKWDARIGLGATIGLTENWALRADWDRFRVAFPGTKEDVDLFMIGAQYSFR
jgi:OOP family OmpA-OmpF porin